MALVELRDKSAPRRLTVRGHGNRKLVLMQDREYIPRGICQCGCGRRTSIATQNSPRYGWIKGEPVRFISGHQGQKPGPQYIVRDSGCWEWQHGVTGGGYGALGNRGAHVVFWEREHGPVPKGAHLHHKCENPPCVNPAHLEPLMPIAHARAHSPLTAEQVRLVREVEWTRSTARILAERFGVKPHSIRNIRHGRTWSDA